MANATIAKWIVCIMLRLKLNEGSQYEAKGYAWASVYGANVKEIIDSAKEKITNEL